MSRLENRVSHNVQKWVMGGGSQEGVWLRIVLQDVDSRAQQTQSQVLCVALGKSCRFAGPLSPCCGKRNAGASLGLTLGTQNS